MRMFKYENESTGDISVQITNDYKVYAMQKWDNEQKKYFVTLWLKRSDIGLLDKMEKAENIEFESEIKTIKTDISKHITRLYEENFFNYYINRYEEMLKCFDIGSEILDKERLGA